MPKFKKKPVVIEAMQFHSNHVGATQVLHWINESGGNATWFFNHDTLQIETLEGLMSANDGDWIIRGVKGEFYPCKPDIFEQTYEPVEG